MNSLMRVFFITAIECSVGLMRPPSVSGFSSITNPSTTTTTNTNNSFMKRFKSSSSTAKHLHNPNNNNHNFKNLPNLHLSSQTIFKNGNPSLLRSSSSQLTTLSSSTTSSSSSTSSSSTSTSTSNILETSTPFDIDSVEVIDNYDWGREFLESSNYYRAVLAKSPTLVLNADYKPLSHLPLSVWNWQDSMRAIFADKAVVVSEYTNVVVRSVSCEIRLPSVIALKQFRKNPVETVPSMTRRKVFIRDGFRCQYCQHCFPVDDLSLDHVQPRARGGKLIWTNTVTACLECNFKKGHHTLDELKGIGMKLKALPRAPSTHELQAKARRHNKGKYHPHWMSYV